MPAVHVEELESKAEWERALPLLGQLWTDAGEEFLLSWRHEEGYHLLGLFEGETLVGVAGVSVQRVLHHARHAWVHDFVVDEPRRSEGLGAELLARVEAWARERDCEYVALAARLDNEDAVDFYEAEGMERWGYVLETEL